MRQLQTALTGAAGSGQLQPQATVKTAIEVTGDPPAAGPEIEQSRQIEVMGLEAKTPSGAAPVATGLKGEPTAGGDSHLTAGAELLLIETQIGPAPQAQGLCRFGKQAQIERIPETHLQAQPGWLTTTAAEDPEGTSGPGAQHHLGTGKGQPQHRHPLLQARQGVEADGQPPDAGVGMIGTGATEAAGADRQTLQAQAAVGTETKGMSHGLSQLLLQPGLLAQILALELAVEEQGAGTQSDGKGGHPPADATARTG